MGDRAGLLRLLRDLRAEQQAEKAANLEAAIVGLFDEIREELNNEIDQLHNKATYLSGELERVIKERDRAEALALETVRSTKEAAELRINQLRERHDMETKPLYTEIERLRSELEEEKFSHWQVDQALNTVQQEVPELHALNLYDLVGDADQLRADMVGTIKERDELRKIVESLRKNIGMEIAKHAYTKSELERALKTIDGQNESYSIQFKELLYARAAIAGILAEPYGCPMCDSGKLRTPKKSHWPDCPYAIANDVLGLKAE